MKDSYFALDFDVEQNSGNNPLTSGNQIFFGKLSPIALFCKNRIFGSSGKEIEIFETVQNALFLFNFLKNIKDSDVLTIGFQQDFQTFKKVVTNDK